MPGSDRDWAPPGSDMDWTPYVVVVGLLIRIFGFDPHDLGPARTLGSLGLDRFDRARLALALEDTVQIRLVDADLGERRTIEDVVTLLQQRADERALAPGRLYEHRARNVRAGRELTNAGNRVHPSSRRASSSY